MRIKVKDKEHLNWALHWHSISAAISFGKHFHKPLPLRLRYNNVLLPCPQIHLVFYEHMQLLSSQDLVGLRNSYLPEPEFTIERAYVRRVARVASWNTQQACVESSAVHNPMRHNATREPSRSVCKRCTERRWIGSC